jgi:hypothetical protein
MKKGLLIILLSLSTFNLFSQLQKGSVTASLSGNYTKTTTASGGASNYTSVDNKNLNVATSLGYNISNKFILGVGLDYIWEKEIRTSGLYLQEQHYAQFDEIDAKSKILLPNIFVGYYYQIVNKLYFQTNLKFSYGKLNSKSDIVSATAGSLGGFDTGFDYGYLSPTSGNSKEDKYDVFCAEINPELIYFISKNIGAYIDFGGIEYSISDWKKDNSNWVASIKPVYWQVGVKINIL